MPKMDFTTQLFFVLLGFVGPSLSQTEWRPPLEEKFYRSAEPTTIFTPADSTHSHAWYLMEDRSSFTFRLKSCHSAHIILSEEVGKIGDKTTEIHLGTHDNKQSSIWRYEEDGQDKRLVQEVSTPELVHCNEMRSFWIRWVGSRSHRVEVGRGPHVGQQKFMDWLDEETHHFVRSVGLTGWAHSAATWEINENTGEQLAVNTPNEHKYERLWKSVRDRFHWSFNIKACGHCHVVLAEDMGRTDGNVIEFVIGGWDNQVSVIRNAVYGNIGDELARAETPDILACDEYREFWISWANGYVQLGHGSLYGHRHILTVHEPIHFRDNVRYLAITTGFGATGTWLIEDDAQTVSHIYTPSVARNSVLEKKYNTTWIESPRKEYFKFSVSACHDATVHLSEYDSVDAEFGYEIVIGAENNTKIVLQYLDWVGYIRDIDMNELKFDCENPQPRMFWASWSNNQLRFGYGPAYYQNELWERFDLPDNFRVRSLALTTVENWGLWRIRETVGEYLVIDTPSIYSHFLHVWRTMRDKEYFVFQVKACSDAHVAFSATNGIDSSQWYYDLVICGWSNTWTVLRKRRGSESEDASEAFPCPQLMKCDTFVDMWVSWYDGRLEMGMGPHPRRHIYFQHQMDDGLLPIKSVSVSSGWDVTAKWRIEEDNGEKITYYTKNKYDINQLWMEVGRHITWFSFRVRACSDAIIYLSQELMAASGSAYEIVIGANNNQQTQIRRANDKQVVADQDTPGIVNCSNYRQFWVGWTDGVIKMGIGSLRDIHNVILYDTGDTKEIQSVAMTGGNTEGETARWEVRKNSGYRLQFQTGTEYEYEQCWRSVEHSHQLMFSVKACSDVHVALSERITYHYDHAYEVVLGGWDNSKSVIRQGGRWDTDYATLEHSEKDMVSCDEHVHFWIQWRDGAIVVGKGQNPGHYGERIMDYHPLQLYDVRFVGFTTATSHSGEWDIRLLEDYVEEDARESGSSGLSAGAVAGIVFGCLAVVLIAVLFVMYWADRKGGFRNLFFKSDDQTRLA